MAYFKTCPRCGANLDPGEVCDCTQKEAALHPPVAKQKDAEPNRAGLPIVKKSIPQPRRKSKEELATMDTEELRKEAIELFLQLKKPERQLAMLAYGVVLTGNPATLTHNHSKGTYKRAIKILRAIRSDVPEDAARLDEAVEYIRREWMERG